MKRIFAGLLILTICLSLFNMSALASDGITFELVDFVSYIDIEDDNSVIVKLTNNSGSMADIDINMIITDKNNAVACEKSVNVSARNNSVMHYPLDVKITERGEYTLTISASQNGAKLSEYTKYIYADYKVVPHNDIGVCTHFNRGTTYTLSDLETIKKSGFTMIRDECRWDDVELKKGEYKIPTHITSYIDKANELGIDVLMMLSYNNSLYSADGGSIPTTEDNLIAFGEYVRFVVKSLKGKVKYFEVWNEPNHEDFNPNNATAAQYVELLEKAYGIIKYENPDAYVISGGTSGSGSDDTTRTYIQNMVEAGGLNYIDGLGIHPYCCWTHSIVDERNGVSYASDINKLINDCGINKDIWITEVGYTTQYPEDADEYYYTEEEKGAYNVRTILEFKADKRVKKLFLYQFRNTEVKTENFQLINADNTAGEGYKMVRNMNYLISNADFVKKWSQSYYSVYQFTDRETGDDIFIMWSKGEDTLDLNVSASDTEPKASYEFKLFSNTILKLDLGSYNAGGKWYKYDAYGNKTEITAGVVGTIDFRPTYIVCEKTKKQDYLNIEMENGSINGTGYIGDKTQYVAVRAVERNSKKTVYLEQIELSNGEFEFSFKVPNNGVYEIYVYNGEVNYEKMNIGSVDTELSITTGGELLNKLSQLNENDNIEALATIESKDESLGKVYFVAAVYNHNNQLLFTKVEAADIDTTAPKPIPLEFAATNINDWKLLKFFVWDAGSLKPLIKNLEFEK